MLDDYATTVTVGVYRVERDFSPPYLHCLSTRAARSRALGRCGQYAADSLLTGHFAILIMIM